MKLEEKAKEYATQGGFVSHGFGEPCETHGYRL